MQKKGRRAGALGWIWERQRSVWEEGARAAAAPPWIEAGRRSGVEGGIGRERRGERGDREERGRWVSGWGQDGLAAAGEWDL